MLNHTKACILFVKSGLFQAFQWALISGLPWSIECYEIALYERNHMTWWIKKYIWHFLDEDQRRELDLVLEREDEKLIETHLKGCDCEQCEEVQVDAQEIQDARDEDEEDWKVYFEFESESYMREQYEVEEAYLNHMDKCCYEDIYYQITADEYEETEMNADHDI